MFSQTAEYALRAVVSLAYRNGNPATTRELGDDTRVPVNYLSKVLQGLVKKGVVHSKRGLHGGFVLAVPVEKLSMLDVINAVEPLTTLDSCPLSIEHHKSQLCPLHRRLNKTISQLKETLALSNIKDLLEEDPDRKPLCELRNP